ncbi:MAG TPA: glycoside hydrolase family 99-like domain-containing protein, partial [Acidobacteriota bacterium]|nr:glycoside hydrolase family 99-like domain-containing protein [Acidobacteriota bacterium]
YDTLKAFGRSQPPYNFKDSKIRDKFISDFDYISKTYFADPHYLKFSGRPVVWIYIARAFEGKWKDAIEQVREVCRQNGFDVYLDGDLLTTNRPDPDRISYFDAASAYVVNSRPVFYKYDIRYTGQVASFGAFLFNQWAQVVQNIRCHGSHEKVAFHPVISPQFYKPEDPGALRYTLRSPEEFRAFAEAARDTAPMNSTAGAKVIWVTSWNEWYEGTAIEPTKEGDSPSKNYGFDLLHVIHDVFGS